MTKLISSVGLAPSLSSMQSVVPGSVQSSINALTSTSTGSVVDTTNTSTGNVVDVTYKTTGSSFNLPRSNERVHKGPTNIPHELKRASDRPLGGRTEKVIDGFLESLNSKVEDNAELTELVCTRRHAIQSNWGVLLYLLISMFAVSILV